MERTTSRHMAVGTGSKRLADALRRIVEGETLERATSRGVMHAILNARSSPAQLAGLLAALATRGVTVEELVGFAEIMRASAEGAPLGPGLMDTCGTGGSGKATVNTSTLVAFILAAAGVKVAKHGNRASSGKCGSADVLEALGIRIDIGPAQAAKMLRETNVAFLYAPRFHPAMRHVMSVRKELGFRTVFNLLGPLCNPAKRSTSWVSSAPWSFTGATVSTSSRCAPRPRCSRFVTDASFAASSSPRWPTSSASRLLPSTAAT